MSKKLFLDLKGYPETINKLSFSQLDMLSADIREELLENVSKTGGHLASNLGVVELTVALLKSFDPLQDRVVWDVGHQCYPFKLLTGRRKQFSTLRQQDGISGFPKTQESPYDAFISGHASTSLPVAFGIKKAMTLNQDDHTVIAVIGDGSMTGGMAYEGLNNIGKSGENLIVVLNDNEMAISKNEGALARYLSVMRSKPNYFKVKDATDVALRSIPVVGDRLRNLVSESKTMVKQALYPSTFFEEFGFTYYGPIDGHDIKSLCEVLAEAKEKREPALIHIETVKGKGYTPAERNPGGFHGVSPFNIETGEALKASGVNFSEVFGRTLTQLGKQNSSICAVTAAMEHGTGLQHFARAFKKQGRFFDVGIAEELAVTFCAGLSAGGKIPVLALYSTFLQRGYDQLIHDASIEKRHMIIGVDRAGIVGDDGETHQGLFDAAFLSTVPNIKVFSPSNYSELKLMLKYAVYKGDGLQAIRYPRGAEAKNLENYVATGKDFDHINADATKTVVVTYGRIFAEALKVCNLENPNFSIIKLNVITPIREQAVLEALNYKNVVIVEEGILNGGIAMQFASKLMTNGYSGKVKISAIEGFVPQGKVEDMLCKYKLDANSILEAVNECEI